MNCKSGTLLLLPVLMTLLLLSCSTPKELEYRDFKNFTINKVGFASSTAKMDMIYYNPNNFGLQLKKTDLDIYINGVFLGHSTQEYQVTIPKKDQFVIPVVLVVDMKNLLKNGLTALLNKQVMLKVTGSVRVGKANLFMNIPVNYEGPQEVEF